MNDLIAKYKIDDVTYENISQKYSDYFKEILEFQPSVSGKIKKGTYSDGSIDKFVNRFYNKITDKRLDFLFGDKSKKIEIKEVLEEFTGYNKKSNITIIDLRGVPKANATKVEYNGDTLK